jgi:hypothetical protein
VTLPLRQRAGSDGTRSARNRSARNRSARNRSARNRSAWLFALFLVVAFGPFVPALSSQPASRLALTAAIAEHHTVDVRGYPLGIDRATYDGHLRSDKAPGQPLVAVPVYLVAKAVGAQSAAVLHQNENLTAWWVTFWTSFLPFVALVVLMYLVASRYAPAIPAFAAAAGLGVCSMLLPHGVNLYGATFAALGAYGAWALIDGGPPVPARLLAAGALAGGGGAMENETAIVLVALAVVVLVRARGRAAWYALGAIVPGLVIAWYQTAAFGRPWRTAHEFYATAAIRKQIVGYEVGWRGIDATFFGSHSLLLTNAIVLVGLVAAILLVKARPGGVRRHAMLALGIAVPYLVLCATWKGTPALEEPGPRYLIPLIPFLAVPLAVAWPRIRQYALIAMGVSGVVAIGAATTNLLTAKNQQVLPEMVRRVVHGEFHPTVWSMGLGWFGVGLYAVAVVGSGALLVRALRAPELHDAEPPLVASDDVR